MGHDYGYSIPADETSIDALVALLCRDVVAVTAACGSTPLSYGSRRPESDRLGSTLIEGLRSAVPASVSESVIDVLAEATLLRHLDAGPGLIPDADVKRRISAASENLGAYRAGSPQTGLCHSPGGGTVTLAQRLSTSPDPRGVDAGHEEDARRRVHEKRCYNERLEAYLRELREGGSGVSDVPPAAASPVREIPRNPVPAPSAADEPSMFLTVNVNIAGLVEEHQVTVRPSKTAHSLLSAFSEALHTMYSVDIRPMHPVLVRDATGQVCPPSQGIGTPPLCVLEGEALSIVSRSSVPQHGGVL
eukprot:TRINITY_DN29295_c0_g1_i1.p1 TRINITY_DN29295_c0_g1~~TRINITY_DN29295_c0_g1_i1.p1  ORF type:complete len:304 (+),score=84.60 TRINITY_DN29295_c0_g1_i1:211-1122(+)